MVKKVKEGEFLPALMVAASRDSGGEGVGDGRSRMCLWAEISTDTCMVSSNVIEKIKIISCGDVVVKTREEREFLPAFTATPSLGGGGGSGGGGGGNWVGWCRELVYAVVRGYSTY